MSPEGQLKADQIEAELKNLITSFDLENKAT
jgi:hypothetical protein